jgi:hypothetical protein
MGLSFSDKYLRETYSVPAIENGDVVVQPNTAAGSSPLPTITPSFSEGTAGRKIGTAQMAEFGQLEQQLRDEADKLLHERVAEIATALVRQGV